MDTLKTILTIIALILFGYIVIRIFAYGIAKSVIDAIHQYSQNKLGKENKNGVKKEAGNERQAKTKN